MRAATGPDDGHHTGRDQGSLWGLQWVMVVLGLAIAAVLLLRGSYVLGLLIAALATVRVVYVVGISRRRRALGEALGAGRARAVLRELAPSAFILAAGMISLDRAQARGAFDRGSSLAELAAGAGLPVERMVDAIVRDASEKLDREVSSRRLTQGQASLVKARLPVWANRLVHFRKGDLQRIRSWA